jgi:hypothetical protein
MLKLLLLLALQFLFVYLLLSYYKSKGTVRTSRVVLVASLFFYFSVIALVVITNYTLRAKLDSFDLNHDGMFNRSESTPAQKEALQQVSSDTSATFAPIVAIPFSLVYFLVLYVILRVFRKQK